jgi:hypothetical protein
MHWAGFLATAIYLIALPVWASESSDIKVMNWLSLGQDSNLVVVSAGADQGIVSGAIFRTYRLAKPNSQNFSEVDQIKIETGQLKAVDIQKNRTIAAVISSGSDLSKQFFPKHSGVMAGDFAVVQRLSLVRKPAVLPSVRLSYRGLFEDPKATPTTFELTESGRAKLREESAVFAGARMSLLMVEGYTDPSGPSDANQVESWQRAMTVRQFLIDELGFDPERVVAIGLGEGEPEDVSVAPGSSDRNRRIVLKVVPVAD